MITQADYERLRLILQADRLANNAPIRGDIYSEKIDFAIRIEVALEGLVDRAGS